MHRRALLAVFAVALLPLAGCTSEQEAPPPQDYSITLTVEPRVLVAGERLQATWHVDGPVDSITRTALVYSPDPVARPRTPGDYPTERGVRDAVRLPETITTEFTFTRPGEWYLRAYLLSEVRYRWSEEIRIDVVRPTGMGTHPVNVSVVPLPREPIEGENVTFAWNLEGRPQQVNATGLLWGRARVLDPASPSEYPSISYVFRPAEVPGIYFANVTFDQPGAWFVRAFALRGTTYDWSEETQVDVEAATDR